MTRTLNGEDFATEVSVSNDVEAFYGGSGDLTARVRDSLRAAGKDFNLLTTADTATFDEFHIRGRQATLELAERMGLVKNCHVLDIGSGLGGPARTLAEVYGCRVTGIDLTQSFCEAATAISGWLGLSNKVRFAHGDATELPFESASFDAAMTIHVAMNIPDKSALYAGVRRVLKPGAMFAIYDVLQGEGGQVRFPVPWAHDSSASHLVTPQEMRRLLSQAGFQIVDEIDSTEKSFAWFQGTVNRAAKAGRPMVSPQAFLGADWPRMARNQVQNLAEKRARTVTFACRAPS